MANQITVTTKTLASKATELQSYNRQLNSQINTLKSQERSVFSMWEGDAKNAFDRAFQSDVQQMQRFYQEIEKYVAKLNEIIRSYDAAEAKNVQTATTRTYK